MILHNVKIISIFAVINKIFTMEWIEFTGNYEKLAYQNNILVELVDGTFKLLPNASGVRLSELDCGYNSIDGSCEYPQGRIVAYMVIEPFKLK